MTKITEDTLHKIELPEGYTIVESILNLKQIEKIFHIKAATIRRERSLQKLITQGGTIPEGQNYNPNGIGFKLQPVQLCEKGVLQYYTKDIAEHFKKSQQPSPEQNLKAGTA